MLALWVSLAVHAAIIGLVRMAPRTTVTAEPVLEARLENPVVRRPAAVEAPMLPDSRNKAERRVRVPQAQPAALAAHPQMKPASRPEPVPEPPAAAVTAEQVRPNNPEPVKNEPGPIIAVPLAEDRQYYVARELDVQPHPLRKVVPLYPPEYESRGAAGYAILEMRVETDGQVSDLKVIEISPSAYEAFGREALAAFHDVRFEPARRRGLTVRALFRVKVVFEVTD